MQACTTDGWWWQVVSTTEVDEVLAQLNQGCNVPIVALLDEHHQPEAERLQAAGVHIAHTVSKQA